MSEWNYDLSQAKHGNKYTVSYAFSAGGNPVDRGSERNTFVKHGALLHKTHGWLAECPTRELALVVIGGIAYTELEDFVYAFADEALPDPAPLPEGGGE